MFKQLTDTCNIVSKQFMSCYPSVIISAEMLSVGGDGERNGNNYCHLQLTL